MQLKKIAIVFLVVIMMFSLAAIGIAAEETEFALSVKAETDSVELADPLVVKAGSKINYVVYIDSNPGALTGLEVVFDFNNEVLEFKGVSNGVVFDATQTNITPIKNDAANANGFVQVWMQAKDAYSSDATGKFITLEFVISDSFDGSIDADDISVSYAARRLGEGRYEPITVDVPAVEVHDLGDAVVVPGNCVNEGASEYKCTHEGCDYVVSIPDGKLGEHTFVKVDRIEPTEEKAGIIEHQKCSVCYKLFDMNGKEIKDVSIPKLEKPIVDIDTGNPVVTIVIIVVAVLVVAAGAVAAVVVLKKKKIL